MHVEAQQFLCCFHVEHGREGTAFVLVVSRSYRMLAVLL
jgi:hypothetical protein